jgi:hypothetical protein
MKKTTLAAILHLIIVACIAQTPAGETIGQLPYQDSLLAVLETGVHPPASGLPSITLRLSNKRCCKTLSNILLQWQVLVNGQPQQQGSLNNLPIPAGQSLKIHLPARVPTGSHDEVYLNILYKFKKQEGQFPAGTLLARQQLLLKAPAPEAPTVLPAGELTFQDDNGVFLVSTPDHSLDLQFNKQTGWLRHYEVKGAVLLNDSLGMQAIPFLKDTQPAHLQLFSTSTSSVLVIVRGDYEVPGSTYKLHMAYTINAKGEMLVEESLEQDTSAGILPSADTPPLKMYWSLPPEFDSLIYYGDGPQALGIYQAALNEGKVKTGIRWCKSIDHQRKGILLSSDSTHLRVRMQLEIAPDHSPALLQNSYHYSYKVSPILP